MKRTRTLIVDDHAPFRTAVGHWLKDFAALEVAGSCATDCSTLPASAGRGVDLLHVGLGSSGQADFELARRLKADLQAHKLVLMSLFPLAEAGATAVAAGAESRNLSRIAGLARRVLRRRIQHARQPGWVKFRSDGPAVAASPRPAVPQLRAKVLVSARSNLGIEARLMSVPLPKNEAKRIEALRRYDILDTPPDQALDDITLLAAHICDAPIALITFVDSNRQWFKSKVGLTLPETAREIAFCAHAILNPDQIMVVPDALADQRFAHNPSVTGDLRMRSYTGVPLVTEDGYALGTLCVIDRVPRELTPKQLGALRALRRSVVAELELRRLSAELQGVTSVLADRNAQLNNRISGQAQQLTDAMAQRQTEIAEKAGAEALLRASEIRFRTLWETTTDAIVLLDEQSRIQYANPALGDVFGYEPGDVIGKGIDILQPPPLRAGHTAGFTRHLRTGVKTLNWRSVETSGRHRSGREFPVEIAFSRMDFDGKPFFAGFIRDITDRKQLQEMAAGHRQVLEMIASGTSLEITLNAITQQLDKHFPEMLCSILLVDESGTRLHCAASSSFPEEYHAAIDGEAIGPRAGSCGTAAYRKELVVVKDIASDPLWTDYRDVALRNNLRACWSHPIISGNGEVLGTLAMYYHEPREPATRELDTIKTVASLAGIAIERKQAEAALLGNVERFQMVARATNDAIWDWDLVTNAVWWGEGYQTLFGYRAEEIKPGFESWHDPIHPEDRERVVHGIHALIDSGGRSWTDEYRFRRRDGIYAHIYDRGFVSYDKDGKAVRMIGAMQDITGRIESQSFLRDREARFRTFAEQSPDAMVMHQEGEIVFVNDALVTLMRAGSAADLVGRRASSLVDPARVAAVEERIRRLYAGQKLPLSEQQYVRLDGSLVDVEVAASSLTLQGKPAVLVTIRDITERKRAEEGLVRFRMAMETSLDGIFLVDFATFRYLDVNQTGCRMLGYSREELLALRTLDVNLGISESDQRQRFEAARALGPEGVMTEPEGRFMRRKDGATFPIEVARRYVRIGSREIIVGIARDITQRVRSEAALRESEARLAAAQTLARIGNWRLDLATQRSWWSAEMFRIFGFDPASGVPGFTRFLEHVHAGDREAFESGHARNIAERRGFRMEYRFIRGDGTVCWIDGHGEPVFDEAGNLTGIAGTAQEITERKQMELALRDNEERFRTMANSIVQLAWMARADGYIYWYNQRWYEYTGTTPEQMEGWGWQSVHDSSVLPQVMENWTGAIAAGKLFEMEFPLRGADGRFRRFLTRGQPLKDSTGQVVQWFGTNTDVEAMTEVREQIHQLNSELEQRVAQRTAELHAKNKELETFSYSVSHDLMAPLRGIDGYSRLLLTEYDDRLDGDARTYLRNIRSATAQMQQLIDDLLAYSKLEQRTLAPNRIDLRALLEMVLKERTHDLELYPIEVMGKSFASQWRSTS